MAIEQYSAVIAAGGAGERYGTSGKLRQKLGGKSLFSHGLDLFDGDERCNEVLVCASAELKDWISGDPLTFSSTKLRLIDAQTHKLTSIMEAVSAATSAVVVVHDAINPNVRLDLIDRLLATVKPELAAVPVVDLPGTPAYVTQAKKENSGKDAMEDLLGPRADHRVGHLMEHPDESGMLIVQTPQAYFRESLLDAAGKSDDLAAFASPSALYMAGGGEVAAVRGIRGNLAIHTEDDFRLVSKLMGTGPKKKEKYTGLGW